MFQGNVKCRASLSLKSWYWQNTQEQCCVCKQKIVGDCVVNNKTFYHPGCMKVQSASPTPQTLTTYLAVLCLRGASEKRIPVLSKQTNLREAFQGGPGQLLCVRQCDRGDLLPAQRQDLLPWRLHGSHGRHLCQVLQQYWGGARQDYRVKLSPSML